MNNLLTTIMDKVKSGYIYEFHYKYFNCIKVRKISNIQTKNTVKKELFLTYKGFQRVINISRNSCLKNNSYIMQKWLDNFDKIILKNYKINIKQNIKIPLVMYILYHQIY